MKSPDDHIDNELRNALRNRFDDFELKPGADLKTNIFKQLRTWQQEQAFQRTLIISLLFAILFTGTMFYSSKQAMSGKAVAAKSVGMKTKMAATGKPANTAVDEGQSTVEVNASAKPLAIVDVRNEPAPSQLVRKKAIVFDANNVRETNATKKEFADAPHFSDQNFEVKSMPDSQFVDENISTETPAEKLQIPDVAYLNSLPANLDRPALVISDSISYFENASEKHTKNGSEWTLIAGVTPVQSFQILNILPNPEQLYRNFEFPGSASFKALGYKLNAGVEKNGLQLLLSYGQYRQSVRYEVAGNEFEIIPNGSNAEARRKYASVSSERTLKLVGVGVRKQLVPRAPALRVFYGVAGVEFTRELTEGRNIVWANAGIGRQVRVGRNTALHIGPYFEYGFTKLLNAEGSFQVKPYQVGLSVILRNKLVR
ncbi:hypothetical protein [Dyadobacter crusticola]|uniref:hypothetical protein n=1 Tax=Dyadobacter crusticola TaxID=292407 RepID=UPI0004E18375|nr:hypothetical protein [Dyadobacter crusticola]